MSGLRVPDDQRYATDAELARAWRIAAIALADATGIAAAVDQAHAFVYHAGRACPDTCDGTADYRRQRILDVAYLARELGELGFRRAMRDVRIWTAEWPVVVIHLADSAGVLSLV